MAYSSEVKDYAKELYLTVNENGDHKYSLQDIVEKIQQKFNSVAKCPDRSTVQMMDTKNVTKNTKAEHSTSKKGMNGE